MGLADFLEKGLRILTNTYEKSKILLYCILLENNMSLSILIKSLLRNIQKKTDIFRND